MTVASDSFTLLDEAVALLKRSRGARSRQLARQTVRGALKAVVREAGQVGDHHARALADDLQGAWRSYEAVKDGDVRNALGHLVAVSSSLARRSSAPRSRATASRSSTAARAGSS